MRYDTLAEIASTLCEAPVSLVTFIDNNNLIFKGSKGTELQAIPVNDSLCVHTIQDGQLFEVTDIDKDSRFDDDVILDSEFQVKAYCGHVFTDEDGTTLGTVCVMDNKPRAFTETQKEGLELIAKELSSIVLSSKKTKIAKHTVDKYKIFYDNSKALMCSHTLEGAITGANKASADSIGYSIEELKKMSLYDITPKEYHKGIDNYLAEINEKEKSSGMMSVSHKNGDRRVWLYNNVMYNDYDGKQYVIGSALDITVRHKLEFEHKRLKEMLEQTNSVAKIGGWEVDVIKNVVHWSPITKEIHDVPQDFVPDIDKGISFYKDGYSKQAITTAVKEATEHGKGWDLELQIVTAKGKDVWVRAIGNVEFHDDVCIRIYGTFQDIDAKKKAELEILNSRKLLEDVLDSSSEVSIISTTPDGIITVFNKGAEKLLGYNAMDMVGKETPAIIHDKDEVEKRGAELTAEYEEEVSGFEVFIKKCKTEGAEQREWTYINKDGKRFAVSLVVTAIKDAEQNITGYLGIATDITERKKAERDLEIERARLSAFVTHAPAAVAMFDTDIRYIAYSNRWLEEYKIEDKNIIGVSHYEVFPNVGQEWKDIHQRCLNGEVIAEEEDIWRPAGWEHDQYLRWEVRPWYKFDGSIGGIMMLTQDVTSACLQRDELKKAKQLAEQASIAKSDFLANMSHEIRTPLNGVIGFTDLMLKTDLTETQHQYLSIVDQSGNALLAIINDILDFSKIEAGKLELDVDRCDLYEINNQASDIVTYQVHKKGLEMLLNISTSLPRFIWVDSVRLKQVLVNLLGNATKFTEKGEIELKISQLNKGNDKITLRFEVRDTGIGIKKEKQEKIFDAFSQEDTSTTKKYGGTGLGLTISNRLLELMGSKLQLDSAVGKGSTFYFDLNVKYEDGDPVEWEEIDAIEKVLVVDDNSNNRMILKDILQLKSIASDEAKNGYEALQFLSDGNEYDLILLDYHMPFMDGLETARKIRAGFDKRGEKQPIIFLHSSSDDQKILKECKELNIQFRLVKPIKIEDIYRAMSQLFIKKEAIPAELKNQAEVDIDVQANILIAEDNTINMLLAKTVIKKIVPKANFYEAEDGLEALKVCAKERIDIIFMDIQMPNMNGYDATKEIRTKYGDEIIIIALTAGNVKGEREKCLQLGMNDFIAKPFVETDIIAIFNKWLKQERNEDNEVFDINVLNNYLGGDSVDSSIVLDVIQAIISELEKEAVIIESEINAEVSKEYIRKVAHKLRGTSHTVGLTKLKKTIEEIDKINLDDNIDNVILTNHAKTLLADMVNVINFLKSKYSTA